MWEENKIIPVPCTETTFKFIISRKNRKQWRSIKLKNQDRKCKQNWRFSAFFCVKVFHLNFKFKYLQIHTIKFKSFDEFGECEDFNKNIEGRYFEKSPKIPFGEMQQFCFFIIVFKKYKRFFIFYSLKCKMATFTCGDSY